MLNANFIFVKTENSLQFLNVLRHTIFSTKSSIEHSGRP